MSETLKNNVRTNKRIAVVLFNLGGPDSLESVKPFLFNLFNDKFIIRLPKFLRCFLAWIISTVREKKAQKIYAQMGGKSTILPETEKQALELKKYLSDIIADEFEIFICMRHWHPMSDEVIKKIESYSPSEIILLPLYPQYSTTTTGSSIEDFVTKKDASTLKNAKLKTICCYPIDDYFIKAHSKLLTDKLNSEKKYRILFSAHGLPKKIIDEGDPYQWQVERTAYAIIKEIGGYELDYRITYQSRVGPLEWIGPCTEKEITAAAKDKINLIVMPIAFVSEHSETLVELDIEYKAIADKYSIDYVRLPTLSIDSLFIKSLGETVIRALEQENEFLASSELRKICPDNRAKCPCKLNK